MRNHTGTAGAGRVERLVRHDRLIVAAAVAILCVAAALYTFFGVGMKMSALDMTRMARPLGQPMDMGGALPWTPAYAGLVFAMWWVMMIAMMTPSAAPMILLYTALKRVGPEGGRARVLSLMFLAGYLAAWAVFSGLATAAQWGLEQGGLAVSAMMAIASRPLAGVVLVLAGLYQFSALKDACLSHCRSPAQFLALHNRPGALGAFRVGAHHGVYCLGCCWALMALLFVGGIMNLYWIVGIALYVLVEKLAPNGRLFTRAAGVVLIGTGLYVLSTAWT